MTDAANITPSETNQSEALPRGVSRGDLLFGCLMSSLLTIAACLFIADYFVDQRDAAFAASTPRLVTVDEQQLLSTFLNAPEHTGKSEEEFEAATLEWARKFQTLSDELAERNNLIVLRRSNVAAGAEDITAAIGRALYRE